MEVTTIGLDLGRDVFQVHGIAGDGTVVFNRSIIPPARRSDSFGIPNFVKV